MKEELKRDVEESNFQQDTLSFNVYKTTTPIPVITVNLKGNLKTVNIKKNQKPYIKATFIPLAASI